MARKPKVTLQKIEGEPEWIVWIGARWGGVVRKLTNYTSVWSATGRKRSSGFLSRKEAVAWLVGK